MKTTLRHRVFSLIAVLLIALSTSVTAQNNGPFVKVEQPSAAGIEWVAGNSYLISWTDNLTKPVLIELVNYGATPVTYEVINPSAEGSTWVWPIPAGIAPGNQYKIKIFSTVNNAIVDWSDEFFSIVASATGSYIKVEQPSLPNIKWVRGTTNVISWDDNMPGKVKVELLNDNPQQLAYDKASNYGGSWTSGDNHGTGFGPWDVNFVGVSADASLGDPATAGITNMDNPSFYVASSATSFISVDRPFDPLPVGSTFSCEMATNLPGPANTFKGVVLYSSQTIITEPNQIVRIIQRDTDVIEINDQPMFNNPGTKPMKLNFEYFEVGKLRVYGTGRDGVETYNHVFDITGIPQLVRFGSFMVTNDNMNRRLFFNNLKITKPTAPLLLADNVEGTTHYWPITNAYAFGDKYKIRVTSKDNPLINDISDNYFAITATEGGALELLQPNSPSPVITWVKGSTYLISWNGNGYFPVKVELLKSGTPVATIGGSVSGTTTTWQVPGSTVSGNDYKIKVTRIADGVSVTGAAFSIQNNAPGGFVTVEQPSEAGIEWIRGTSHLISWNTNIAGPVDIELANYNTGQFFILKTGVTGSTWVWDIPESTYPVGTRYKIKIWANNQTVSGISSNEFALADYPTGGTITVLQPSVSDLTWLRGSQNLISWNPTIPGPFNIELYCPTCTPAYHMIKTGVVGSTWVWDIPELTYPVGAGYKIKVWSSDNASVSGVSEHPFDLADTPPGGTIEVLQPNGGEFLYKEVPYLISWIDDIPEAVNLKLLRYNSSHVLQGESIIANNVEGTTHIWNIPGTVIPSDYYKVKVMSSLGSSTVYDLSDDYFSIQLQPLTVSVYPNPAKNYVNVKFAEKADESYTVQLKDRFNMTLSNVVVNAAYDKEIQISTAQLPNGVYFLTIVSDKTKTTEKIVVQH